jgi:hypothetical protein
MKRLLTERIAKENDFKVIDKLDENTKQYLKEYIQNTILDRYNYQPLEHIQEMIDEAVDWFEDDLQAINYISDINYNINDTFYEKLKEDYSNSHDDTICDWEDEFEKPKEDIKLNKYTLTDFIDISFIDGIDLMVEQFEDNYKDFPYLEHYKESINDEIERYTYYINLDKGYEKESFLESIQKENELIVMENKVLDNPKVKLTKREINLITTNMIFFLNKGLQLGYKEKIANDYNINNNTPQTNQGLLDNSYDVIINTLKKLSNRNDIIKAIQEEKNINSDLFTNTKRIPQLKARTHYMSFLYKCNSVYTENNLIVFQEFVEALISGYMQFLEFENKEQKIKSYNQDLEVLKRYNSSNENDKNIQELEDSVSFLSISKPNEKLIPFKELSNRLEIDTNQIANYIKNTTKKINRTHKDTINQNFQTLQTLPKEICISHF